MGLRTVAESDLSIMLEDTSGGFSHASTLIDPTGKTETINVISTEISRLIDPETGVSVSGSYVEINYRISTLITSGFTSLPKGIVDQSLKPWIVKFDNIQGTERVFKIIQSDPDQAAGILTCILGAYTE